MKIKIFLIQGSLIEISSENQSSLIPSIGFVIDF